MALSRPPTTCTSAAVTIGVDPHKSSHTAAVLDSHQQVLAHLRVPSTRAGYRALRRWAARWSDRRWAIENATGLGRTLAQWLLRDAEAVVDVPPKLAARVRVLSTGHGRKTDPADAVSTALKPTRRPSDCSPIAAMTSSRAAPRSSTACTACWHCWLQG
jgi:transposase